MFVLVLYRMKIIVLVQHIETLEVVRTHDGSCSVVRCRGRLSKTAYLPVVLHVIRFGGTKKESILSTDWMYAIVYLPTFAEYVKQWIGTLKSMVAQRLAHGRVHLLAEAAHPSAMANILFNLHSC